ncbi:MAG: peptidylprolyl isomerase [Candidatus Limnocylindrales bacterium]
MITIRSRTLWLVAATILALGACGGGSSSPSASAASTSEASEVPPSGAATGGKLTATIVTPMGDIVIALKPDTAPIATANFVELAEAGYYDGVAFHRLVPDFVIQGGDGKYGKVDAFDRDKVGTGGPGYTIQDEPVVGDYIRGSVSMARTPEPNSQGSQFFIALQDLAGRLDKAGGYVIFGQVVEGMDVVDAIGAMPNAGGLGNTALEPVPMESVTITRE